MAPADGLLIALDARPPRRTGGVGGMRRDGPPEKIAVRAAAPAASIELREDRTGRWYIFRGRSDDLEQVGGRINSNRAADAALCDK
jgi:hypothetical protein